MYLRVHGLASELSVCPGIRLDCFCPGPLVTRWPALLAALHTQRWFIVSCNRAEI